VNTVKRMAMNQMTASEDVLPPPAAEVWDRFTVHNTPTHGSWLNQAEIEIGMFSRQCLGKRRNSQSEDPKGRGQSLEPPHKPGSGQDRLEI
jgi:hypothetical protein